MSRYNDLYREYQYLIGILKARNADPNLVGTLLNQITALKEENQRLNDLIKTYEKSVFPETLCINCEKEIAVDGHYCPDCQAEFSTTEDTPCLEQFPDNNNPDKDDLVHDDNYD